MVRSVSRNLAIPLFWFLFSRLCNVPMATECRRGHSPVTYPDLPHRATRVMAPFQGGPDRPYCSTQVTLCVCHGVMVSTPGPTSRRRQLPAVPAGPEWHNTAASATPCATLREPPPPFPALSLSTPHGMGSYRADHTAGPPCRSLCTQSPQCIQFCQSNKFCMGTHPMPPVLPEVINSAWAHTQCLRFCQK